MLSRIIHEEAALARVGLLRHRKKQYWIQKASRQYEWDAPLATAFAPRTVLTLGGVTR